MSQPKLSQTALFEVLVSEFESIKNTKREFNKILTQINAHLIRLEQLYNKPIPVDTNALHLAEQRIQDTLDTGFYIPKWLVNTFLTICLVLFLSLCFNYKQYVTNKDQGELIEQAKEYIQELKEQIPKSKSKK
jgi:hypothetical protein